MITKNQIKLIKSLRLKKNRKQSGFFVAEGEKIVDELLKSALDSFVKEHGIFGGLIHLHPSGKLNSELKLEKGTNSLLKQALLLAKNIYPCLLYTSPSPRD